MPVLEVEAVAVVGSEFGRGYVNGAVGVGAGAAEAADADADAVDGEGDEPGLKLELELELPDRAYMAGSEGCP